MSEELKCTIHGAEKENENEVIIGFDPADGESTQHPSPFEMYQRTFVGMFIALNEMNKAFEYFETMGGNRRTHAKDILAKSKELVKWIEENYGGNDVENKS